jgi:hypothetical protein
MASANHKEIVNSKQKGLDGKQKEPTERYLNIVKQGYLDC